MVVSNRQEEGESVCCSDDTVRVYTLQLRLIYHDISYQSRENFLNLLFYFTITRRSRWFIHNVPLLCIYLICVCMHMCVWERVCVCVSVYCIIYRVFRKNCAFSQFAATPPFKVLTAMRVYSHSYWLVIFCSTNSSRVLVSERGGKLSRILGKKHNI